MQFTPGPRSRGIAKTKIQHGNQASAYPHALQFYTLPPTQNISLQEFEEFAVERLKVLQAVETAGIRNVKGSEEYRVNLPKEFKNLKCNWTKPRKDYAEQKTADITVDREKDHISHFTLRLAYCRTEELRRWFIAQELDLFRFRFTQESRDSIYDFLKLNHLDYRPIPDEEKNEIKADLIAAAHGVSGIVEKHHYYKVPFTEALDLVKNRKVFLKDGYAYVPQNDLVVIILSVFRTNLSHALAVASRALPQLEEDDRILPLLTGLSKRYLGQDYSKKKPQSGVVTADMIDELSKKSFPMCMQHVHQSVRQNHHLKHWGRMQYGLFLKAIGLSLDEAMRFWRAEFTKLVDPDKFEKTYAYNIRHNYGKEGKRADYTPYSCIKIITSNAPGPGDHHGCPFRHFDADMLQQRLQSKNISKDVTTEILGLCKQNHFQLACGRYFEHVHNVDWNFNPNHPNQYFEESQKVLKGDRVPEGLTNTPNRSMNSSQNRGVKIVASQSLSQKSSNISINDTTDDFGDEMTAEDIDIAMRDVES